MTMKSRTDQAYIEDIMHVFDNIEMMVTDLAKKIGYEAQGSISAGTIPNPKRLVPSGILENPRGIVGPFVATSLTGAKQHLIDIGNNHYYPNKLAIETLSNIQGTSIYLSASPDAIKLKTMPPIKTFDLTNGKDLPGTEAELILAIENLQQKLAKAEKPRSENDEQALQSNQMRELKDKLGLYQKQLQLYRQNLLHMTRYHAISMFNAVSNDAKGSVTCIILGDSMRTENAAYIKSSDTVIDKNFTCDVGISHMKIVKIDEIDSADLKQIVDLYYLHSVNGKLDLSSYGLGVLHSIYKKTIGNMKIADGATIAQPFPLPMLFISKQGLDRAAKLAFAFYLFQNFDQLILSTKDRIVTKEKIENAYRFFRHCHSPSALSEYQDIAQAFYIAFALKLIEIEQQCIEKIKAFQKSIKEDNRFGAVHQLLDIALKDIAHAARKDNKEKESEWEQPSLKDQHFVTRRTLALGEDQLKKNVTWGQFFTPGPSEQYQLVKDLNFIIAARVQAEKTIVPYLRCEPKDPIATVKPQMA